MCVDASTLELARMAFGLVLGLAVIGGFAYVLTH